jgi:hypothetical protein
MKYLVDIDNTICYTEYGRYEQSVPDYGRIDKINELFDAGHEIIYFTARGMGRSGNNVKKAYEMFFDLTKSQLKWWGAKHHDLILGKPSADFYIDDKAISDKDFFGEVND